MAVTVYFARPVSYSCEMFMKYSTSVNVVKLFFLVTDEWAK